MMKTKSSRVSFLAVVSGLFLIGLSAYLWKTDSPYNEFISETHTFKWVRAAGNSERHYQSDIIYSVSGKCIEQIALAKASTLEADLERHLRAKPQEILDYEKRPRPNEMLPTDERERKEFLFRKSMQDSENLRAFFYLQNKYINWYMAQSDLETRIKEAKQTASSAKDFIFKESERRSSFYDTIEPYIGAHYSIVLLDEEKIRLRKECMTEIPIVKIIEKTERENHTDRWLKGSPLAWIGFCLLAFGLIFGPAASWVRSGQ